MRKKYFFIFSMLLALHSFPLHGQPPLSFDELWLKIKAISPEMKRSQLEWEAADLAHRRTKLLGLPRASLQFNGFTTNNAATTLFSNLGERTVTAGDFNPDSLNNPGYGNFLKGSFLVTMPLYEGGLNSSQKKITKHLSIARNYDKKFSQSFQFSNSVVQYALLLSANQYQSHLKSLKAQLDPLLNQYEIGSSQNLVGHSGLLGLQALSNRLNAASIQIQSEIGSLKYSLSLLAGLENQSWAPQQESVVSFLSKKFGNLMESKRGYRPPPSVEAAHSSAKAAQESSQIEKAALLPHVGFFSESNASMGSRDTSTSTTVGGYLQWNILSPAQWGAPREKWIKYQALQNQAYSEELKSKIDYQQSKDSIQVGQASIALMQESLQLLSEQTRNSRELYANGAINVLQIAELLNRRADLIGQIHQAENQLSLDYAKNYLQGGLSE